MTDDIANDPIEEAEVESDPGDETPDPDEPEEDDA